MLTFTPTFANLFTGVAFSTHIVTLQGSYTTSYFRWPDHSGCQTEHRRLSSLSSSRRPHLEHASTARHLCLIVDCIQTAS